MRYELVSVDTVSDSSYGEVGSMMADCRMGGKWDGVAGLDYAGRRAYNRGESASRRISLEGWVLESAEDTLDGGVGGESGDVSGGVSGRAPGRNPHGVENRPTILGVMSAGHGVAHLYDQGVPVMLPEITS